MKAEKFCSGVVIIMIPEGSFQQREDIKKGRKERKHFKK